VRDKKTIKDKRIDKKTDRKIARESLTAKYFENSKVEIAVSVIELFGYFHSFEFKLFLFSFHFCKFSTIFFDFLRLLTTKIVLKLIPSSLLLGDHRIGRRSCRHRLRIDRLVWVWIEHCSI